MNKLPCYGITARALQILVGASAPIHEIPAKWFNWVGRAPGYQSSLPPFAPERLSIVSAPQEAPNSAARWCKNSLAAGYDCIFIDSVDDKHCVDELGLENGIGYDIVAPSESGRTENPRLQNELREPDEAIVLLWDNLRLGGGAPIEKMGFAEVTVIQWIAYGRSMHDWIQQNTEGNGASVRTETPDFSKWNPWERFGGASRMLSLSEHFDTLPTDHWPWSVENPITKKDVPNLASDIEAFWPMRQMPFCGVARTFAGELKAVGALPDAKDINGNWLWDDGTIRNALSPTKKSFSVPLNVFLSQGVRWIAKFVSCSKPPMIASASARGKHSPSSKTASKIAQEVFIEWVQSSDTSGETVEVHCKLFVTKHQLFLSFKVLPPHDQDAYAFHHLHWKETTKSDPVKYDIVTSDSPGVWEVKNLSHESVSMLATNLYNRVSVPSKQNDDFVKKDIWLC